MRTPLYDVSARRKTVSITLNADLAERTTIREEIREETRITDDRVARHGMPFPEFSMFSPDNRLRTIRATTCAFAEREWAGRRGSTA